MEINRTNVGTWNALQRNVITEPSLMTTISLYDLCTVVNSNKNCDHLRACQNTCITLHVHFVCCGNQFISTVCFPSKASNIKFHSSNVFRVIWCHFKKTALNNFLVTLHHLGNLYWLHYKRFLFLYTFLETFLTAVNI